METKTQERKFKVGVEICQYDMNGKLLNEFPSMTEAGWNIHMSPSVFAKNMKKSREFAGYKWGIKGEKTQREIEDEKIRNMFPIYVKPDMDVIDMPMVRVDLTDLSDDNVNLSFTMLKTYKDYRIDCHLIHHLFKDDNDINMCKPKHLIQRSRHSVLHKDFISDLNLEVTHNVAQYMSERSDAEDLIFPLLCGMLSVSPSGHRSIDERADDINYIFTFKSNNKIFHMDFWPDYVELSTKTPCGCVIAYVFPHGTKLHTPHTSIKIPIDIHLLWNKYSKKESIPMLKKHIKTQTTRLINELVG